MANMSLHTVTLAYWRRETLEAVITIDSEPEQYKVTIPLSDPSFSQSPPSVTDAINYLKAFASTTLDAIAAEEALEATYPDLSIYVNKTL